MSLRDPLALIETHSSGNARVNVAAMTFVSVESLSVCQENEMQFIIYEMFYVNGTES